MANTVSKLDRLRDAEGARLPYLPALDGLRALAVLAVVSYHAGIKRLSGGFVGVEIFFVISGYLITSLLLAEWRATGHIALGQFWLRRARRLLPALFLLLVTVLAVAVLFLPQEVAGLRKDAAAATGYVTNWYLVLSQKSYFESIGRPSLLRHLWSLAVEEQFYLLWPLLFSALVGWLRPRRALWVIVLGAAASMAGMYALYRPDGDPSRVYYGTDTRAAGLLLGAALAFFWAPGQPRGSKWWQRHRLPLGLALDGLGLFGLAVLAWVCLSINEFLPALYRGGFQVVDLATVLVIMAVVHPGARGLPFVLGLAPLRWAGTRSYGIYLWHWPIFMLTRPQLDVPLKGLPLLALQLAATAVIVELSFRYLETPIRKGALERAWRTWREAREERRRGLVLRWTATAFGAAACFAMLGQSIVRAQPPAPPAYLAVQAVQISASPALAAAGALTEQPAIMAGLVDRATGPDRVAVGERPSGQVAPDARANATASAKSGAAALPAGLSNGQLLPVCRDAGSTLAQNTASVALFTVFRVLEWADRSPAVEAQPAVAASAPQRVAAARLDVPEHGRPGRHLASTLEMPDVPAPAIPKPIVVPRAEEAPPSQPMTVTLAGSLPAETPAPDSVPVSPPVAEPTGERVIAVGDSVMIAAASILEREIPNLNLDARVGRQASSAIQLLAAWRDSGRLGAVAIIQIGSNGTFSARQFDEMMALLADARRVIVVNVKVPRSWEGANNAVLSEGVKRYPNAVLLDWHAASVDRPELFWDDGIHLRPEGAQVYADLIAAAVKAP